MAASSTPTSRTVPPVAVGSACVPSAPPKPPTMMFSSERFMASAMSLVRMPPAAPTSAPAMMSSGLSSTKPDIAAAVPVKEFRRLMTTGMSAPPMGSTMVTPKVSETAKTTSRARILTSLPSARTGDSPAENTSSNVPSRATMPRMAVVSVPPGTRMGLPLMSPCSLPEAMSEPAKVMLPMTTPRTTKMVVEMSSSGVPTTCP